MSEMAFPIAIAFALLSAFLFVTERPRVRAGRGRLTWLAYLCAMLAVLTFITGLVVALGS